jgi:hypothetical protein
VSGDHLGRLDLADNQQLAGFFELSIKRSNYQRRHKQRNIDNAAA